MVTSSQPHQGWLDVRSLSASAVVATKISSSTDKQTPAESAHLALRGDARTFQLQSGAHTRHLSPAAEVDVGLLGLHSMLSFVVYNLVRSTIFLNSLHVELRKSEACRVPGGLRSLQGTLHCVQCTVCYIRGEAKRTRGFDT